MILNEIETIIFTNCPAPIMIVTAYTSIVFVNALFEQLTGFTSAKLIGKSIPYSWWRNEEVKKTTENFTSAIDNGTIQDNLYRSKDGRLFWARISISKLLIPRLPELIVLNWQDITAQKQAEEEVKRVHDDLELRVAKRTAKLKRLSESLRKQINKRKRIEMELIRSREQLRVLYTRLQSLREEDRSILAREIHDVLGQNLTALNLYSSWVYDHLPKEQEQLRTKVKEILGIIDSTTKTAKKISTELRPGLLDDLGIVSAMEWQAKTFQDTTNIKYEVHSNLGDTNLNKEQNTVLFRIFHEALTNVIRHARASKVNVLLNQKNGNVILVIQDNGIGITKEQIHSNMSLGLLGMHERARSLNGILKIKGSQGRGTAVNLSIPLNKEKIKLSKF